MNAYRFKTLFMCLVRETKIRNGLVYSSRYTILKVSLTEFQFFVKSSYFYDRGFRGLPGGETNKIDDLSIKS